MYNTTLTHHIVTSHSVTTHVSSLNTNSSKIGKEIKAADTKKAKASRTYIDTQDMTSQGTGNGQLWESSNEILGLSHSNGISEDTNNLLLFGDCLSYLGG